jgi:hypothetical protein
MKAEAWYQTDNIKRLHTTEFNAGPAGYYMSHRKAAYHDNFFSSANWCAYGYIMRKIELHLETDLHDMALLNKIEFLLLLPLHM